MKKLSCILGHHDWKTIKREDIETIDGKLKYQIEQANNCKFTLSTKSCMGVWDSFYKYKKICRKCYRVVDEIELYERKALPLLLKEVQVEQIIAQQSNDSIGYKND